MNILQSTKPPTPWLATSSQWSNGYKTLTFTIRNGATWSDGKPFSADDVAYTFNAMKSDKAIDLNALWTADGGPLTNVALKGTDQVVFTFNAPSQPYFYFVADLTPIRSAAHLVDAQPEQAPLVCRHDARRHRPVSDVELLGVRTSSTCATRTTGRARPATRCPQSRRSTTRRSSATRPATWPSPRARRSGAVSTSPTSSRSTSRRTRPTATIWFPPVLNVSLVPNLTNPLLSQLAVRQATSHMPSTTPRSPSSGRAATRRRPTRPA